MTSRELVYRTLEFRNTDGRVPRQMWLLPWAEMNYGSMVDKIRREYEDDIVTAPCILQKKTIAKGEPYKIGEYTDEWGCRFNNIHEGIIGEVKAPLVRDEEWEDADQVHIPLEWLEFDTEAVNEFCRNTDKFVLSGCCPRPFEQLQFIRTTEELYMDLMDPPANMLDFLQKMHSFYCELVEKWAKTDIDAISFMDDWGSQQSLLINPKLWDKIFRPMYRDYIAIAKKYGKKTFMHSDGNTLDIYPRMIELGLDAFNTQIFCIGLEQLEKYKGKITFWGEIDRQHLLPDGSTEDIENAVKAVYERLWSDGGCIAQCEFGPGAKPDNVYTVFRTWDEVKR
ncbi:methylcobalamin:coenzyme M methyltransferase [[Eubacterium] contortum]|uniref:Methylcobalamin:coenzyme M methyltransferase n=1 Tax=Faecalicatena contorta TaxID=39482 RepID=A0A174J9Z2_9FIRM|nr:uroporphyrinogen decarboxylase family protein [Faecalicatena contorta]CUO94727.1 methylcobalamin:coenzyme M methyltransferase [[Eubacterium] contortum] [Faecalicatena contorta]